MSEGTCNTGLLTVAEQRGFFADTERGIEARLAELTAKRLCWGCPVKDDCLEYAISANMHGIWGGLNRRERKALIRSRRQP